MCRLSCSKPYWAQLLPSPKCLPASQTTWPAQMPVVPPGLQERLPRHSLGLSCQNHCLEGQQALLWELWIPWCALLCLETWGNQIFNVLSERTPCYEEQQLKTCWLIRYQRGSDTAGNRNILEEPDVCNALGQEFPLTASQTSWEQCLLKVPSGELHHQEGKKTKGKWVFWNL